MYNKNAKVLWYVALTGSKGQVPPYVPHCSSSPPNNPLLCCQTPARWNCAIAFNHMFVHIYTFIKFYFLANFCAKALSFSNKTVP